MRFFRLVSVLSFAVACVAPVPASSTDESALTSDRRMWIAGHASGTIAEEQAWPPDRVSNISTVDSLNGCHILVERTAERTRVLFYLGSTVIRHSWDLRNELPGRQEPFADGFSYTVPRKDGIMHTWTTRGHDYVYEGRSDRGFGYPDRIVRETLTMSDDWSRPLALVVRASTQNLLQSTVDAETSRAEWRCAVSE